MGINALQNNSGLSSDRKSVGGSNDPLAELGKRVSDTLQKLNNNNNGLNLDSPLNKQNSLNVSPIEVRNYMAEISQQPLPGLSQNVVV
ncbi:MAG: hypothetical protein PHH14_05380 [Candidatus Margulisbacteria bacterium]|nr:hypothetical protein [Candidatus Margulisiibacteriota bacterium]